MNTTKKITLATVKSFIRKNRGQLLINVRSSFDGMTDCCQDTGQRGFTPALDSDRTFDHNMGIMGVWFVFGSRDYFSSFNEDGVTGYRVSNCCGSFIVGIRTNDIQAAA